MGTKFQPSAVDVALEFNLLSYENAEDLIFSWTI